MSEINNKKRITWIDVAIGIAIIFVLLSHYERSSLGRIGALGYLFSVQMFFLLSGMFANCEKYTLGAYIKRQAKALLLPYYAFSAINVVFHYVFNRGISTAELKQICINILLAKRNHMLVAAMWFLPCLFLVSVVYKLLTMAVKNKKLLLALCFVASAFAKVHMQEPILPFTANQAARFVFYFAAGSMIYPYIRDLSVEKFRQQSKAVKAAVTFFTFTAPIAIYILYKNEYIIYWENDFIFYASLFRILI